MTVARYSAAKASFVTLTLGAGMQCGRTGAQQSREDDKTPQYDTEPSQKFYELVIPRDIAAKHSRS